ncbi:Histidine--tRNA ligase, partial [Clarias magur]
DNMDITISPLWTCPKCSINYRGNMDTMSAVDLPRIICSLHYRDIMDTRPIVDVSQIT